MMVGEKRYLPNGGVVESEFLDKPEYDPPSGTARHEALHLGAGINIAEEGSIIPDGDSLGHARFSRHDSAAAAAAHAYGMGGTSWDLYTIHAAGNSVTGAIAEARMRLAGKDRHVDMLAGYLQARRQISGNEARKVWNTAEYGSKVRMEYRSPEGEQESEVAEGVIGETVMIPNNWYDLPPTNPPQREWIH